MMICVVKQSSSGEITGWMMGGDMHDLRRRAEHAFERELAAMFYQIEFVPAPGKHEIAPGVTMLVE